MMDLLFDYLQSGLYYTFSKPAYLLLLFLVVLITPYLFNDWKRVLIALSLLTLGHCFGLFLSSYDLIVPNTNLLWTIMLLSILMLGLFNIFTSGKKSNQQFKSLIYLITLVFGLIHGLKFSGQLQNWVSGSDSLWLAILITGLGILIGQVIFGFIILFLSFICQTIFRFSKRDWVMVISAIVVGSLIPLILGSDLLS